MKILHKQLGEYLWYQLQSHLINDTNLSRQLRDKLRKQLEKPFLNQFDKPFLRDIIQ